MTQRNRLPQYFYDACVIMIALKKNFRYGGQYYKLTVMEVSLD